VPKKEDPVLQPFLAPPVAAAQSDTSAQTSGTDITPRQQQRT
jgi:hypothetical protein